MSGSFPFHYGFLMIYRIVVGSDAYRRGADVAVIRRKVVFRDRSRKAVAMQ